MRLIFAITARGSARLALLLTYAAEAAADVAEACLAESDRRARR